jgi:glycosyltransferase involved in cell wall biosynthesis
MKNPRMKFNFISSPTFEPWDWTNPISPGIGGSETSHVEMSQRLARRGHDVLSFAPVPFEGARIDPAGVKWQFSDRVDWNAPGVFVLYRDPTLLDYLPPGVPAWLICQDTGYQTLTEHRAKRLDRIVALCQEHATYLKSLYPFAADKVCISSNGIRSGFIGTRLRGIFCEQCQAWPAVLQVDGGLLVPEIGGQCPLCGGNLTLNAPPVRNPKRLIYASSPDRGLRTLIQIFLRVREIVPDVELHVYYGFDNIDKVTDKHAPAKMLRDMLLEAFKLPGIHWHGRTGQIALIEEWFKAGIWCHPSDFTETSCITCMDAQACGAIPVTTPVWAISENVQHGVMVEGQPESDPLTLCRYVLELVRLIQDPERQEAIRQEMMPWALQTFDWERFVGQWEGWADLDLRSYSANQCPRIMPEQPPIGYNSKEIQGKRAIGTIAYMGGIQAIAEPWVWSLAQLVDFTHDAICQDDQYVQLDRARFSLHWAARNQLADRFLGDWLLMLDCDVVPEPDCAARLVTLMMRHNVDVVSGMYPFKQEPNAPIIYHWNDAVRAHEPIVDWDPSADLIEYSGGGAGCLLIRRTVFDRMRSELKEEPFSIRHPLGEDTTFYERCRRLGIKCYFAPRVQLGHLDFVPRQVRRGAIQSGVQNRDVGALNYDQNRQTERSPKELCPSK